MTAGLRVEPRVLRNGYGRRPFTGSHRLANDARFLPQQLVELARRMPPERVEFRPAEGGFPDALLARASPSELLDRLAAEGASLTLTGLEEWPGYRELVLGCIRAVDGPGAAHNHRAEVRLLPPNFQTPVQACGRNAFWLLVQGEAEFLACDPGNREVLPPQLAEKCLVSERIALALDESLEEAAERFTLVEGDLVHVPPVAPHWLRVGSRPAVCFSFSYLTPTLLRRRAVSAVNRRLRKLGATPLPFGLSPVRDHLKEAAVNLAEGIARRLKL